MAQLVKATSKGQITLPVKWRRQFDTNQYLVIEKKGMLQIKPIDIEKIEKEEYFSIFDKDMDNNGEGIPAEDFIKLLEESLEE